MLKVPSLDLLVHELSRLPGIGQKTAQRLAYFILRSPDNMPGNLKTALDEVQSKVKTCPGCFSVTEDELCHYCADAGRDSQSLCVVEEPMDIMRVESSGVFKGRYHVLQGAISPLEGIQPQDLKIQELFEKIDRSLVSDSPMKEVILALDTDLEGDTTVLYLAKKLKDKGIRLTRIAHGVPIGTDIEYIDHRTLGRALENRVEI
jgi:recombination protein RecR